MKTYTETTAQTLVAFHIGRGGRFYNAGHLSFVDQDRAIDTFTDDLFIKDRETDGTFCTPCYVDCSGNEVGLTLKDAATGVGRINIDNDYDTTYVCRLEDCDDDELHLIAECAFVTSDVQEYAADKLGIEIEQVEK